MQKYLLALLMLGVIFWFPKSVYADIQYGNDATDSCNKLHFAVSESPVCPQLTYNAGGNQNACRVKQPPGQNYIGTYVMVITVTSNDGKAHTFDYHDISSFCTNGYATGDQYCQCSDNLVREPASGSTHVGAVPKTITITRSSTDATGTVCGVYQIDFFIDKIDNKANCKYEHAGGNTSGTAGLCETGRVCGAATPTPTPIPTYTVSGNVFNDTNKDEVKDNGESDYAGGINISASGGTVTTNQNGTFTISGLTAGTYTISYTSLPSGYQMVYPKNGAPPSFAVTVGPGCSVDGTTGGTCDANNNIQNLNFSITNSTPWFQVYGLDTRFDNGQQDPIPQVPTCPAYALNQDPQTGSPGVYFSGDSASSFGQGKVSTKNWSVGGTFYPEVYASSTGFPLTVSYEKLSSLAQAAGIVPTDLTTFASCTNLSSCTLPANLADGIYIANGDLTIVNNYTFAANRNYIFLVNGTLTFKGTIQTPAGSTALFAAQKDIVVDRSVGAAANICPVPQAQIQAILSTDRNFTADGIDNCLNGKDKMLNLAGAVVVNASGNGGSFVNHRDLCGDNPSVPSVTISDRLDFLLNLPTFLSQQPVTSEEVSP